MQRWSKAKAFFVLTFLSSTLGYSAGYDYRGAQYQLLGKVLAEYVIGSGGGFVSPSTFYLALQIMRQGCDPNKAVEASFAAALNYGSTVPGALNELKEFKALLVASRNFGSNCDDSKEYRFRPMTYMAFDYSYPVKDWNDDMKTALSTPTPDLFFKVDAQKDSAFVSKLNTEIEKQTCGILKDYYPSTTTKADVLGLNQPQYIMATTNYLNGPWGTYSDSYVHFISDPELATDRLTGFWGMTEYHVNSSFFQAQFMDLPFGVPGTSLTEKGRVTFIVPTWTQQNPTLERTNLQQLLWKWATNDTERQSVEGLLRRSHTPVDFAVPKLNTFTTTIDLKPILSTNSFKLADTRPGLTNITDAAKKPYPRQTPSTSLKQAFTKNLEQKNVLEWDKYNVIAVSITSTNTPKGIGIPEAPRRITVNRPFLAIVSVGDIILHAGIVMNPTKETGTVTPRPDPISTIPDSTVSTTGSSPDSTTSSSSTFTTYGSSSTAP